MDADVTLDVLSEGFDHWLKTVSAALTATIQDPEVCAFKSVVCYRTGLDVDTVEDRPSMLESFRALWSTFRHNPSIKTLRLQHKSINDYLVRLALHLGEKYDKPLQFHCGMGDRDIRLTTASPAHLKNLIEAYPNSNIVLLHSSYPYTREAGYLTAMYSNVFMDFGEVCKTFTSLSRSRTWLTV